MPRKSSTDLVPKRKEVVNASKPSFLSNVKDGIAYGIGNAIAHRMIGSALNGSGSSGSSSTPPTANKNIEYEQCLKENTKEACDYFRWTQPNG
jgi:hypothetical protein